MGFQIMILCVKVKLIMYNRNNMFVAMLKSFDALMIIRNFIINEVGELFEKRIKNIFAQARIIIYPFRNITSLNIWMKRYKKAYYLIVCKTGLFNEMFKFFVVGKILGLLGLIARIYTINKKGEK